eukprot:g34910.t1
MTAALHGNELNGIPVIWRLIKGLDLQQMSGSLLCCPVLNPPGFLRRQRGFSDGQDLNRLFPGRKDGTSSQAYVWQIMNKFIKHMDYLVDLHTASFGRVNSLYIRADMNEPTTKKMALLQSAQIIVHNSSPTGSLRGAAAAMGVPAITLEIADSGRFHQDFIARALVGCENVLCFLEILHYPPEPPKTMPIICSKSYWLFSQHGGVLEVLPPLCSWVKKGQTLARVRNVWGVIVHQYKAPEDGVVVGKSVDPCCAIGDRLLHLGIVSDFFAAHAQDGH